MRVLIVCEFASLNGGENSMLSVLAQLRSSGVEVIVAAPGAGELATSLCNLGVPLEPFGLRADGSRPDRETKMRELQAIIRRKEPDIVHANSVSMSRIVGRLRMSDSFLSVGHIRDILRLSNAAIADIARNDRLVAVSHAAKRFFTEAGIPDSKINVVHNGVNQKRFCHREPTGVIHRELGLPNDARFLLSVGQLGMRKGVDDSLEVFSRIAREFPHLHMLVVGERHSEKAEAVEYENRLHSIANRKELLGRVHFLGRRNDIPRLMNESEILLHLAHQEPLGRVLLEAAASECCVLATNVGGTTEIFPLLEYAQILVSDSSPKCAAIALRDLLRDDGLRTQIARRAATRIRTHFCCERSSIEIGKIYRQLFAS